MKKIVRLYRYYTSLEAGLFRYSLSFSFLLALPPTLLLAAYLSYYQLIDKDLLLEYMKPFLIDIEDSFNYFYVNQPINSLITLIVSIYLSSRSIYSFLLIHAKIDKIKIPKKIIRIISIIVFVKLLVIIAIFFAFQVRSQLFITRWIGCFLFYYLFYRLMNLCKQDLLYGIKGALLASSLTYLLGHYFSFYINYLSSYEVKYGPLSTFMVLFLAIYIISSIIYLGYCMNLIQNKPLVIKLKYDTIIRQGNKIRAWLKSILRKR